MIGQLHERLVAAIVRDHGAQTGGFAGALWNAVGNDPCLDELDATCRRPGFRPDAWRIDLEARRVELWEVEITSPLSDAKVQAILAVWSELDAIEWELVVHRMDRFGTESELPLVACYFEKLTTMVGAGR